MVKKTEHIGYKIKTICRYCAMKVIQSDSSNDENEQENGNRSLQVYRKACQLFQALPIDAVKDQLGSSVMEICHVSLDVPHFKALCVALLDNIHVMTLRLLDVNIDADKMEHLVETLENNQNICDLDVSENLFGHEAMAPLSKLLQKEKTPITSLDLSGNNLGELASGDIGQIIEENHRLKSLYLRHNAIGDKGAFEIAKALEDNTTMTELDLSWNHLRGKGITNLCRGLKKNFGLRKLNLSWSGFNKEQCKELAKALPKNDSLFELDISFSRVSLYDFQLIRVGLKRNETLKILKMGGNPITAEGAMEILSSYEGDHPLNVEYLDLSEIPVREAFLVKLKKIQETIPWLKVPHGMVLRDNLEADKDKSKEIDTYEPEMFLFEFMKLQNLRTVDLHQYFLTFSRTQQVKRRQIINGLGQHGIILTSRSLEILMTRLDKNKDDMITMEELSDAFKAYIRKGRTILVGRNKTRRKELNMKLEISVRKLRKLMREKQMEVEFRTKEIIELKKIADLEAMTAPSARRMSLMNPEGSKLQGLDLRKMTIEELMALRRKNSSPSRKTPEDEEKVSKSPDSKHAPGRRVSFLAEVLQTQRSEYKGEEQKPSSRRLSLPAIAGRAGRRKSISSFNVSLGAHAEEEGSDDELVD